VPDLRTNLLSVSKICDHGFNIVFKKEKAEIIRATGGEIVFTAPRKLYQIEEKHECSQIAAGKWFLNSISGTVSRVG